MKRKFFVLFVFLLLTHLIKAQPAQRFYTHQTYIEEFKDFAIKEMAISGIPASIILAQALFESGYGNSTLARSANNHFGIKCHGEEWSGLGYHMYDDAPNECFRVYNSVEESFRDHSNFIKFRKWYIPLFNLKPNDYISWAYGLKKCGYATYPNYAEILISLIKKHQLYKYDYVKKIKPKKIMVIKESLVPKITPQTRITKDSEAI